MWDVLATDEYLEWFKGQDDSEKEVILSRVFLLQIYGPNLNRPYSDTIKGSKIKNLKELRTSTQFHVFRVLYFFDEERKALLIVGGDKKGKNQKTFYADLIKEAEALVERYRPGRR